MDKKLIKTMILTLSLVTLSLIGVLIYGIISWKGTSPWNISWNLSWNAGPLSMQKEAKASVDSCEKISLNFASAGIEISTTDDSALKVVQEANGTLKESEKFTLSTSGNTIEIKDNEKWSGIHFFRTPEVKIILYVPVNYNNDIEIKTASGNINFYSDMVLNDIKCNTASGNFKCGSITADSLNLNIASGNITANALKVKSYDLSTTSGNINLSSLSGTGNTKCVSGNIRVRYDDILDAANVSSTSGNIDLSVAKGISFEFYGKCTSGKINSDLDLSYKNQNGTEAILTVGEGPYKKINAKTISGNIRISN
ncbi:MAG: DUF4097 family beta strand repeat-containing protein [Clostridiaceae bacterium]